MLESTLTKHEKRVQVRVRYEWDLSAHASPTFRGSMTSLTTLSKAGRQRLRRLVGADSDTSNLAHLHVADKSLQDETRSLGLAVAHERHMFAVSALVQEVSSKRG